MTEANEREWVDVLLEEILTGKKYRRLVQKCIENMGERRKLYKYYSFDSEFTLSNIDNSINYYNNPVDFNDPFDCNIGISIDQIMRLIFPEILTQIDGGHLDTVTQKGIETILFGNDNEEVCEKSVEAIIAECINKPGFAIFLKKVQSGQEIDDIEIFNFFMNNPDVLATLLKYYFDDRHKGNISLSEEVLTNVVAQSTRLLREAMKIAAADQDENVKSLVEVLGEDDDFLSKITKIAKILGNEIPEDQIKRIYDQLENAIGTIRRCVGETVGITCFSEAPDNMLMWSHYANKHTGICVEYDFSKLFTTVPNSLLLPVEYADKRPLLPIEKAMKYVDGKVVTDQSKMKEILPDVLKSLSIKSDIWSYEREWRHIVFTNDVPNRLAQLPIISRIIMGMKIDPENRKKILDIAKRKHIPVYSTHLKADKYEMIISEEKRTD